MIKLTCVTAVFNAIKSGNRENLIRCVRSVAALKTEHEHLIYDGGSTDGTVELLRELEREINQKVGQESRSTAEFFDSGRAASMRPPRGGESGALGDHPPKNDNSTVHLFSTPISSRPRLRVVSEPDTGIYNALNKGVRDARGDWFYVLGCDDYICKPDVLDKVLARMPACTEIHLSPVWRDANSAWAKPSLKSISHLFLWIPCCHQGVLMKTSLVRKLNGFDEHYQIYADGDLLLRARMVGAKHSYGKQSYAHFAAGGINETRAELTAKEYPALVGANFGLEEKEISALRRHWLLPFRVIARCLHAKDPGLRISAGYMFWRRLVGIAKGYWANGGAAS